MFKKRRLSPKSINNKSSLVVSDLQADTAEIAQLTVPVINAKDIKADSADIGVVTASDVKSNTAEIGVSTGKTLALSGDPLSLTATLDVKSILVSSTPVVTSPDGSTEDIFNDTETIGFEIKMLSTKTLVSCGILNNPNWPITQGTRRFVIWNTVGPTIVLDTTIDYNTSSLVSAGVLSYRVKSLGTPIVLLTGQTYVFATVLVIYDEIADTEQDVADVLNPSISATLQYNQVLYSTPGSGFLYPTIQLGGSNPLIMAINVNMWFQTTSTATSLTVVPGATPTTGGQVQIPDLAVATKFSQSGIAFPTAPITPTLGQLLTIQGDLKSAAWQSPAGVSYPLLAPNGVFSAPSFSFAGASVDGLFFDGSRFVSAISRRFTYGQDLFAGSGCFTPWGAFLRRKTATPLAITLSTTPQSLVAYSAGNYSGVQAIPANLLRPGDILKIHLDGTMSQSGAGVPNGLGFELWVNGSGNVLAHSSPITLVDLSAGDNLATFKIDLEVTFTGATPTLTTFVTGFFNYRVQDFVSLNVSECAISSQLAPITTSTSSTATIDLVAFSLSGSGTQSQFRVTGTSYTLCSGEVV